MQSNVNAFKTFKDSNCPLNRPVMVFQSTRLDTLQWQILAFEYPTAIRKSIEALMLAVTIWITHCGVDLTPHWIDSYHRRMQMAWMNLEYRLMVVNYRRHELCPSKVPMIRTFPIESLPWWWCNGVNFLTMTWHCRRQLDVCWDDFMIVWCVN